MEVSHGAGVLQIPLACIFPVPDSLAENRDSRSSEMMGLAGFGGIFRLVVFTELENQGN